MIPTHPTNDVWYHQPTHWGSYDGSALLIWPVVQAETGVTVDTAAARVVFRAGVTSVEAGTTVNTEAARLVLRAGSTSLTLGATTVATEGARVVLRAADTQVEVGATTVDTLAARVGFRASITSVVGGDVVVLQPIECALLGPSALCSTVELSATCTMLA